MSLISTIVAMGIGLVAVSGISRFLVRALKTQKHIELRGDRDAIRMSIIKKTSCSLSFNRSFRSLVHPRRF